MNYGMFAVVTALCGFLVGCADGPDGIVPCPTRELRGVVPATDTHEDGFFAAGLFRPDGRHGEALRGHNVASIDYSYLELNVDFATCLSDSDYFVVTGTSELDDTSSPPLLYDVFNQRGDGFSVAAFTLDGQPKGWHVDWVTTTFSFSVIR